MNTKKYLPVWTDGLSYDEQHLIFWITDNLERVNKNYSLLPIRLEGDYYCKRKDFYKIQGRDVHANEVYLSYVMPLEYYIAEKTFDSAADRFFKEYPQCFDVTFGKLNFNGIYDMEFSLKYEERIQIWSKLLNEEMEKHLECDEFLEYNTKQELNNDTVFTVKGALDLTQEEAKDLKMSHVFGEQRHQLKSNVKTSKERVLKYFFTIPEHIFNLSNQYIKYNENSQKYSGFFRDAENRDIVAIEKHLKDGIDINTIDSDGRTVFAKYTGSAFDLEKEQCNTEDLKTLLSWGANPAIYGAGFIEEPLENVCLDENVAAVSLLLKSGVNPHSYPCIDEPFEDMSETLLERTERWAVGDPNVDGIPNETQQKILEMLKKYV